MFWLKKIFTLFLSPVAIVVLALLTSFLWAWRNPGSPWPKRIIVASAAALFIASFGPAGGLLLGPLESAHPPLSDIESASDATHVVVLGGGYAHRKGGPNTSALNTSSTVRLNEGVRLHRLLDDTVLVLTGASVTQPGSTAESMGELAVDLGILPDSIIVDDTPRDTGEEAGVVASIAEDSSVIVLVTSASHMPRAVRLFEREGLEVIAAPTHHLTEESRLRSGTLWPQARNIRMVERALYEYVALLWVWFGGS